MNLRIETSPNPFCWDSLESHHHAQVTRMDKSLPFEKDSIGKTRESICAWNSLSPEFSAMIHIDSRPKLEAPLFDTRKLPALSEEIANHLIPKVGENEGIDPTKADANTAEIILFLLYIASIKAQRSNIEESSLVTFNLIKKNQEANKQIMKEYFEKKDDSIFSSKAQKFLNWISWALFGALAVAGVASIALTIVTGGAALPSIILIAKGLLGVSSGAVSITQGVLKYEDNQVSAELVGLETERYFNMDKVRQGIEQLESDASMIAKASKEESEVIENLYTSSMNR